MWLFYQNGTFIVFDFAHITMHSDNIWCKITSSRIEIGRRSYQKSKSKSDWWSKYPFRKMYQLLRSISSHIPFVSKLNNLKLFFCKFRQLRLLQQHCPPRLCAIRQQELFQTIVIEGNVLFLIFQLKVVLKPT